MRNAKVIQVIETKTNIGDGTPKNPNRIIVQYWSVEGKLLAERDEFKEQKELIKEFNNTEANWKIWGGWSGNHDRRIEDARCTNCGYEHPTVYNDTINLAKTCPKCHSKMGIETY